ncbi:MAG: type IX secretion system membrane protein PorP/SprF, partial [Tannerellaceae bacterium]
LSIGLQIGVVNQSFDGTKVKKVESEFHSQADEGIPTTQVQAMALDINAGIYYTHKHFYLGLAATHMTEPEIALEENITSFIGRAYNLTGGYNIQLKNPLFELQPSVFLKTDMQSFQTDITARMVYNKMFNGGLSWRINESVIVLLGATFGNVQVGYAYDLPTTAILKGSSGSHELMVRYKLKLNKTKTGKYKHKSVRIL